MHGSEIESLKADLRRMQARVDELETDGEEPTNRRKMLRGLGAAAAGAAVGGLAFARTASAVDVVIGADNVTTDATSIRAAAGNTYSPSRSIGLLHLSDTNGTDGGLVTSALTINATGAELDVGAKIGGNLTGLKLTGDVPLKLSTTDPGSPSQSDGTIGQFRLGASSTGDLWYCVDDNSSHNWRKLAGLGTAGAFHALTPFRAYDSRLVNPAGSVGILNGGANRTVSIKDSRSNSTGAVLVTDVVPAGATAVTANITVTGTTGGFGFLCVNPGGNTSQATSAINWFGAGQNLANGLNLTLNTSRQVTVVGGTGGGNTHFIIDINGYYL